MASEYSIKITAFFFIITMKADIITMCPRPLFLGGMAVRMKWKGIRSLTSQCPQMKNRKFVDVNYTLPCFPRYI